MFSIYYKARDNGLLVRMSLYIYLPHDKSSVHGRFLTFYDFLQQTTGLSQKDIDECNNLKGIVYEVQTFSGN